MAGQGSLRQSSSTRVRFYVQSGTRYALSILILAAIGSVTSVCRSVSAGENLADARTSGESASELPPPVETLEISSSNELSIVEPTQPLGISVRVQSLDEHASESLNLRFSLYQVERGQTVLSGQRSVKLDSSGTSEKFLINEIAPKEEGVYEFRCELEVDREHLWSRLRRRESSILENRKTLIVMSSNAGSNNTTLDAWKTVEVIRPSDSSWSVDQWLPKQATRLIPGAIGVSSELSVGKSGDESISIIAANNVFQTSLPIRERHLPHKITLRYPATLAGPLRVDVASGDERSGQPVSFILTADDRASFETSASSNAEGNVASSQWKTHTFVYYPSGNDQIWLANLSNDRPIGFESIRVEAGPTRFGSLALASDHRREVALRIKNLNWTDSLSADLVGRDAIQTCSERTTGLHRLWIASQRVSDYAIANGMNSLVVPAMPTNGEDQRVVLRLIARNGLTAWLGVDPSTMTSPEAFFNTLPANLPFSESDVARITETLCREFDHEQAFVGLILDSDQSEAVREASGDVAMKIFAVVRRESPSQFQTINSFVHLGNERLAMQSGFQNRLASRQAVAMKTPAVANLGQADDSESTVTLTNRLDIEACRIIDQVDPEMLMVDLPMSASSIHSKLANVLSAFAAVPIGPSLTVDINDPSSQMVRIRQCDTNGETYLTMISLVPWECLIDFDSSTSCHWEVIRGDVSINASPTPMASPANDPVSATPSTSASENSRMVNPTTSNSRQVGSRHRIALPASEIVVLKANQSANAIGSWAATVSGGTSTTEQIKEQVTSIVQRIGLLGSPDSCDGLINGGFEQSGGMGLVGWMHAQHPPGCVKIDTAERVEGAQAVLMTTDTNLSSRTWLVSETILPPSSGRLAVSMACRGERSDNESVHRLRVSIEATHDGRPIRHSADFDVPCNGKWEPRSLVLEADLIDSEKTQSLRLTIDSLSSGRVWIDDIKIHDQFPTAKERAELQSQAFLAVQGLQRGNMTASARLLQNHWARFLLSSPVVEPPVVSEPKPVEEPVPGVADRMRNWLPRPLRF